MNIKTYTVHLDNVDDVFAVPHKHVGNGRSNSHICTNFADNLRAGKPGQTNPGEFLLVKHEVLVEDESLLETGAVLVEELLGQEREVLAIPSVEMVGGAESDHTEDRSGVERELGRKGGEESTHGTSTGSNIVPIKAEGEHSQTLVTSSTTKDACKPRALLVGEAEDTDTSQSTTKIFSGASCRDWTDLRGNVLREPLPNEDTDKHRPEELDALLLQEDLFTAMEGVEQLDNGQQVREDDVGRVDEERSHNAAQTVADELRSKNGEDTNACVGLRTIT